MAGIKNYFNNNTLQAQKTAFFWQPGKRKLWYFGSPTTCIFIYS